jgi:hypothetical protein
MANSRLSLVFLNGDIRDHENLHPGTDVVDPGGDRRSRRGTEAKLFIYFSDQAVCRRLSGVELPSR